MLSSVPYGTGGAEPESHCVTFRPRAKQQTKSPREHRYIESHHMAGAAAATALAAIDAATTTATAHGHFHDRQLV